MEEKDVETLVEVENVPEQNDALIETQVETQTLQPADLFKLLFKKSIPFKVIFIIAILCLLGMIAEPLECGIALLVTLGVLGGIFVVYNKDSEKVTALINSSPKETADKVTSLIKSSNNKNETTNPKECPKCHSTNVTFQVVTETQLKNAHKSIWYWIFIGWWWRPILWICLTLPMLLGTLFGRKKQKMVQSHHSMGICQDCGHTWKA